MSAPTTTRRRRSDGERSRRTILVTAVKLATVEGLDGLSIGRLAEASGMSKGGLYAHFGSKEELQLATIETAGEIFDDMVVRRGLAVPEGRARIEALADAFLAQIERDTVPGGCFFASAGAEFDTRPGRVRGAIASFQREWMALLERSVREADGRGELTTDTDSGQLAFEINALLLGANNAYLLQDDPEALQRARRGIAARL